MHCICQNVTMSINLQAGYLCLTLPFLLVWLILFIYARKTRHQQLFMSLLVMPLGPFSEIIYFRDYWRPLSIFAFSIGSFHIYPEDLLFGFAIGGIGAIVYEVFFHKHLGKLHEKIHPHIQTAIIAFIVLCIMYFLLNIGLNSIFATSIGLVFGALLIVVQRKDLLAVSFWSGICVMLTMFLCYFLLYHIVTNVDQLLKQGWLLSNTPLGLRIFHIPATEMVWGFSWGMMAGPLYAFSRNLKFYQDTKKKRKR